MGRQRIEIGCGAGVVHRLQEFEVADAKFAGGVAGGWGQRAGQDLYLRIDCTDRLALSALVARCMLPGQVAGNPIRD